MSTATSTNESYNPGLTRTANSSTDDSEDAYLLISKIMVVALAVLIAVVLFVIGVHICARWMWRITPASRRAGDPPWLSFWPTGWRSTGSPANNSPDDDLTVMDADALETDTTVGLDKATVEALPTFRYKTARHLEQGTEIWMAMECAICLGDFEEDEVGRILPKCGHSFHLECIDMWLYSHSTCPLCRAILEPHEDDALSADFETAIQLDPTAASRRVRGRETYQHILPQVSEEDEAYEHSRTEPLAESLPTAQQAQEHEAAKRAVSIPANVLFWGNHTQQLPSAESRLSTVVNTSLQTPFHVAIDVDVPSAPHDQRDSSPNAGSPPSPSRSSFIVSPVSRTSVNFRRLFSRGRLPPSAPLASTTGGAIELPAVMTSP